MQISPINNSQSFKALKITPEAKALIEKQNGGVERIAKYTSELANSKWDLTIEHLEAFGKNCKETLFPYFGDRRSCAVIPAHLKDNYVMVYSADKLGDNEADITDCLKFESPQRAEQVYNKLNEFFYGPETIIKDLDWHVYAMKLFDEAEIVPQKDSPWAEWVSGVKTTPKSNKKEKKPNFIEKLKEAWKVLTK